MKKLLEKIKLKHNSAVDKLMKKSKDKGWTYRRIVADYMDLSILTFSSFIINIIQLVIIIVLIIN